MLASPKKTEAIHAELRDAILSGELAVGSRLPTEPELARKFQCSIGTISKAVALLVHDELVERKPRTGTRVIGKAAAPAGRPTKHDAFAFIYPSVQHESTWRTLQGFQKAAKDLGRRVVTLDTGSDYARAAEYMARLTEFDVCGAVIAPVLLQPSDFAHFSGVLLRRAIPLVLVGTRIQGADCPAVFFDGFHSAYAATRHLLEGGARRVGFLCNAALVSRNSFNGYTWAMEEYGLQPRPEWILRENSMHPDYACPLEEPRRFATRFLKECPTVDAVVCSHDYLALGVLDVAAGAGRSVPGDLKVAGVDDLAICAQATPPLTSYRVPFEESGEKAFEMLQALVNGDAAYPREVMLRGKMVCRQSA